MKGVYTSFMNVNEKYKYIKTFFLRGTMFGSVNLHEICFVLVTMYIYLNILDMWIGIHLKESEYIIFHGMLGIG